MAANDVHKLKITLSHGAQKVPVELELPQDDPLGFLTVQHLAEAAERATGVPRGGQKLIYRGKSLKDADASLASVGIKEGSKVMLIGKKFVPEEDENMKTMKTIETAAEKLHHKLQEIQEEVLGIEKGFLSKELEAPALSKLQKRIALCSEEYLRLLEKLDGLSLGACAPDLKGKRKALVSLIQKHMEEGDALQNRVKEIQSRLES